MTETQRRIKAYKEALPALRERVIAVALLLAMSASMLTSASFAWISLSTAPEVSGMSTTVAANGNLEIALAQGSVAEAIVPPGESAVGDSSSAPKDNWGIANANVTWGNLVNLSDPKYGLSQIVLRPAQLSTHNLSYNPLMGASYGTDGRVISTTIEEYDYASWKNLGGEDYAFAAGLDAEYGVRAVSSVKVENATGNAQISVYNSATRSAYGTAKRAYDALISGETKLGGTTTTMDVVIDMVEIYANDMASEILSSGSGNSSYDEYMWYFHQILLELKEVLSYEAEALLTMANWQAYIKNNNTNTATYATIEEVIADHKSGQLAKAGITLKTLPGYISNVNDLEYCIANTADLAAQCDPNNSAPNPKVYWDDISAYVNRLAHVNDATIQTESMQKPEKIANLKNAVGSLLSAKEAAVVLTAGLLKDIEQRVMTTNERMEVTRKIKVSIKTIEGTVTTSAVGAPDSQKDFDLSVSMDNSGAAGQKYAKDTYGMAIDLWVRTNIPGSYLILEGNTLTEMRDITFVDEKGNTNTLYVLTVPIEESEAEAQAGGVGDILDQAKTETYDVFQNPEDNNAWYYYSNRTEVPEAYITKGTLKVKQEEYVTGYQGENRIWEDWETLLESNLIEKDATTQGSGSCFVFYADTPAEQAKFLELLDSFTIVLIDELGEQVATLGLDTANHYAYLGKVTVPMVIEDGVSYVDEDGMEQPAIMALQPNTPTWLTALIYLHGENVGNENVLATSNITGQLNFQFGGTAAMEVKDDEKLQSQYRTITAQAVSVEDSSKVSASSTSPINFDYLEAGHAIDVNLTVEGEQPERISGFFVRVINSSQGTRAETVSFGRNEDGTWTGHFNLRAPGNYRLTSLMVDGVEYNLTAKTTVSDDNYPSVFIKGMTLDSVGTSHKSGTYMTSDTSMAVNVTAKLIADPALTPKSVWAQFFSEDGSKQYNGQLTYNPNANGGQWEGVTNIGSSGTYILRYLSVDGEVMEISANNQTRLVCYLGLTCRVGSDEAQRNFLYEGTAFRLPMWATIADDTGTEMENLTGVHLYYHATGSSADDRGMHAPMTWDADRERYTAVFELDRPGTYNFNRLTVGSSMLTSAQGSPSFVASSPVPPSYVAESADAPAYQLALSTPSKATMTVNLTDADNAVVWAELEKVTKNADGSYTATGETALSQNISNEEDGDSRKFTFRLGQEGTWRLRRLLCQNIFDNQTYYPLVSPATTSNSYVLNVNDAEPAVTQVVRTAKATVYYGDVRQAEAMTYTFGGTPEAPTHPMFYAHTTDTLRLTVADSDGNAIPGLQTPVWKLGFDNAKQQAYGGYTGATPSTSTEVTLTGSGTTYTAPGQVLDVAGDYKTSMTLSFTEVDGSTYTQTVGQVPVFAVYSAKPTVTVSGIGGNNLSSNTFTSTSATVYAKQTEGTCNSNNYTPPSVSITLNGIGAGESAKVTFKESSGGEVRMYTTKAEKEVTGITADYSWTTDTVVTRWIGYWKSNTGNDTYTKAGTLTADTLYVTSVNGEIAEVSINAITISNPGTQK